MQSLLTKMVLQRKIALCRVLRKESLNIIFCLLKNLNLSIHLQSCICSHMDIEMH